MPSKERNELNALRKEYASGIYDDCTSCILEYRMRIAELERRLLYSEIRDCWCTPPETTCDACDESLRRIAELETVIQER